MKGKGTLGLRLYDKVFNAGNSGMCSENCVGCTGNGLLRCISSNVQGMSLNGYDAIDLSNLNQLWSTADDNLINGVKNGTAQKVINVQGENFTRVYKITWTSDSNDNTSDIFERRDIVTNQ